MSERDWADEKAERWPMLRRRSPVKALAVLLRDTREDAMRELEAEIREPLSVARERDAAEKALRESQARVEELGHEISLCVGAVIDADPEGEDGNPDVEAEPAHEFIGRCVQRLKAENNEWQDRCLAFQTERDALQAEATAALSRLIAYREEIEARAKAEGAREALEKAAQLMGTHEVVWQDGKIVHIEVDTETISPAMRMRAAAIRALAEPQEQPKRLHFDDCAVPDAQFADDSHCTCRLREQVQVSEQPKPEALPLSQRGKFYIPGSGW